MSDLTTIYGTALRDIIESDPEYIGPPDELMKAAKACPECKQRRKINWPPSSLCEKHYREFAKVDRANEDRRRYHAGVLRNIARAALNR